MRRLTPYLLLAILVLGTGVGIGLGLSEAPVAHVTRPAIAKPLVPVVIACAGAGTDESCSAMAHRVVAGPHVIIVPT